MIPDIIQQQIYGLESYSEVKKHLPTWAKKTLSSAGENIGNPVDLRRTQFDIQRVGIYLSCHDSFMSDACCLIIGS